MGAGSVVTENIPPHALVYGNPARIRGFVCRCGRKLKASGKKTDHVSMICSICKEKYKIASEDYLRLEKEE